MRCNRRFRWVTGDGDDTVGPLSNVRFYFLSPDGRESGRS